MVKIVLNTFAVISHANIRNSWKFSQNSWVEVLFRILKYRYLCIPQEGCFYCLLTAHLAFFCHEANIFSLKWCFSVETPLNKEGIELSCCPGACCSEYYKCSYTEVSLGRDMVMKEPILPSLLWLSSAIQVFVKSFSVLFLCSMWWVSSGLQDKVNFYWIFSFARVIEAGNQSSILLFGFKIMEPGFLIREGFD